MNDATVQPLVGRCRTTREFEIIEIPIPVGELTLRDLYVDVYEYRKWGESACIYMKLTKREAVTLGGGKVEITAPVTQLVYRAKHLTVVYQGY